MDKISRAERSLNMSRVRAKNTRPELLVRSLLHRLGYRFRLHRKDLPGTPDIVLPKYSSIVMVHGCFWHRHAGCKYAYIPKSNAIKWSTKFDENVARDKRVRKSLELQGWRVIEVWECETKDLDKLATKLRTEIGGCS